MAAGLFAHMHGHGATLPSTSPSHGSILSRESTGIPCAYSNDTRFMLAAVDRHPLDHAGLDGVSGAEATHVEGSDVLQISPGDPSRTNA